LFKDLKAIVWLMQLGISVAVPMLMFVLGAVWLRGRFGLGAWIIVVGVLLGIYGAVDGLRHSLKAMDAVTGGSKKKEDEPPPVAFNDHD